MTDETQSAVLAQADQSGPPPTTEGAGASPPPSNEVEKDILAIYQRLQNLEAHLTDSIGPKLEALEEALGSLAKRAEAAAPAELTALWGKLSELRSVVASGIGGILGTPGHDAAKAFHDWWNAHFHPQRAALVGGTSTPTTLSAGGGSVTNETSLGASAPEAKS